MPELAPEIYFKCTVKIFGIILVVLESKLHVSIYEIMQKKKSFCFRNIKKTQSFFAPFVFFFKIKKH